MSISTSIIIVTHNNMDHIGQCLKSIYDKKSLEIIVVDNKSSDNTDRFIKDHFPNVELIKNMENRGYGAAINQGVEHSSNDFLVILNPDTKLEPDSINYLLNPLIEDPNIVTIPKILVYSGEIMNTCGNKQHFTGMAFTRGAGERPESFDTSRFVNGLSGACFAISRKNFLELGGFDENIFLYMEDSELSWKINAKGLKIWYVPESIVYHDYMFKMPPEKIYYVEKGRYLILRKYLTWKEYILLAPSLLMTEVLTWGYAILSGPKGTYLKLKGLYDGLRVELNKVESDRRMLLGKMNTRIPYLRFKFKNVFKLGRMMANFVYKTNRRLL